MSLAETLVLNGQLSVTPSPACGCDPSLATIIQLAESMSIAAKLATAFVVPSDAAFPIDLTTVPAVNVLFISVTAKVMLTITTADGTAQTIPVDPLMILFTSSVPITALSITRVSGTDTTVSLVLGDEA